MARVLLLVIALLAVLHLPMFPALLVISATLACVLWTSRYFDPLPASNEIVRAVERSRTALGELQEARPQRRRFE
jgi:hypothetical protein